MLFYLFTFTKKGTRNDTKNYQNRLLTFYGDTIHLSFPSMKANLPPL
jgi:hypothetical protein